MLLFLALSHVFSPSESFSVKHNLKVKGRLSIFSTPSPKSAFPPRNDNFFERIAIVVSSYLLAKISPDKDAVTKVRLGMDFNDFVDITRKFLSLSSEEIKILIASFLKRFVPPEVRQFFRTSYNDNRRVICEQSSQWMTFGLLGWLVGPTERINVTLTNDQGVNETWLSGVKLIECRYLMESGCKSACLNICKGPTQNFFSEELGMQLHMKPNFTDSSCELLFGLPAPLKEIDEAYGQPCFSSCSLGKSRRNFTMCT